MKKGLLIIALLAIISLSVFSQTQETPEWLAGTWEYKPRFGESSWFEFDGNTWVYYRAGEKHSNGIFTISDNTVVLRNPSGREIDEITITENSFEYWGSIFTKK